jgi:hypothetical protein
LQPRKTDNLCKRNKYYPFRLLLTAAAKTAAAANAAQNKYQNEYVARTADFVAEAVPAAATQEQNKYPEPTVSAVFAAAASSVIVKHSFYLLF